MFSLNTYSSVTVAWCDDIAHFQKEFPDAKNYVFEKGPFLLLREDGRDHVKVAEMHHYVVKMEFNICQRILIAIVCIFKRLYYRLKCDRDKTIHTELDNMGSAALRNLFSRTVSIHIKRQRDKENWIPRNFTRKYFLLGVKMMKDLNDKIQPIAWLSWSSKERKDVVGDFKTFWENEIDREVREVIDKETKITEGM